MALCLKRKGYFPTQVNRRSDLLCTGLKNHYCLFRCWLEAFSWTSGGAALAAGTNPGCWRVATPREPATTIPPWCVSSFQSKPAKAAPFNVTQRAKDRIIATTSLTEAQGIASLPLQILPKKKTKRRKNEKKRTKKKKPLEHERFSSNCRRACTQILAAVPAGHITRRRRAVSSFRGGALA